MFGKLGDMMKKLQEMKQLSENARKAMENMHIEYASADGKFKCSMNGNRILKSLHIDPSLKSENQEEFEKKLILYFNEAFRKAQTETEAELKKFAQGLLPGLTD